MIVERYSSYPDEYRAAHSIDVAGQVVELRGEGSTKSEAIEQVWRQLRKLENTAHFDGDMVCRDLVKAQEEEERE